MARILVTTDYLHPGDEVDALLRRNGHQVSYHPAVGTRAADEALTLFDGIAGAIVASEPVTAEMLDKAGELKVIARSGVGYDSIDVAAAAARGIRVCNTPGVNHDAVAELTMALMLMAARRLRAVIDGVRAGAVAATKPDTNCAAPPSPFRLRAQRTRRRPARGCVRHDRAGPHRPPRSRRRLRRFRDTRRADHLDSLTLLKRSRRRRSQVDERRVVGQGRRDHKHRRMGGLLPHAADADK